MRRIRNRFLDSPHGVSIAVSVGLLSIALVVAVFSVSRVGRSVDWVTHTYQLTAQVNGVVAELREAEIEQRAYLITGGDEFRDNFHNRAKVVQEAAASLQSLDDGSFLQGERLERLRALIDSRLEQLELLVEVRAESGVQAVASALVEDAARLPATELRALAREVVSAELALLESRRARMDSELRTSTITVLVCGCIALIMSGHTFIVMRRALAALTREAELIRAKEYAEKSAVEKGAFLANISHEIRTPLNSVLGFAELLRGVATTGKQRQYVDAINASGTALLALINDILDLSKIEAGRLEVVRQPVSIQMLFQNLRSIFRAQAEERGLALTFDAAEDIPPSLMLDPVRLRQILFNVIGNALKFTRQGSVSVEARSQLSRDDETTATLTIRVEDTGIGIARSDQKIIFEPFRQVRTDTVTPGTGTGLGLSITKRLTEMLDGTVSLESEPGAGSSFTFVFQRVPLSAALPENLDACSADGNFNALRPSLILIADDVPLNRELISALLENSHHRILQASSGREAVEAARNRRPDIILMDIRMPDLDGREALQALRTEPATADTPVIAVTASTLVEEEKNLRTMFDGYLRKPFTLSTLFRELARHLPEDERAEAAAEEPPAEPEGFPALEEAIPQPAWKPMLEKLRHIEEQEWPVLSRSMGYRETERFARRLVSLARTSDCTPLAEYARNLLHQVANFEIERQERTLKTFPSLVAALAARVENPRP